MKDYYVQLSKKIYDENPQKYIENTENLDFTYLYPFFTNYLSGKKILDIGFGSWREMKYFHEQWFDVFWLELTQAFCDYIKFLPKDHVRCWDMFDIQNIFSDQKFDWIICFASLVHYPHDIVKEYLLKLASMLNSQWCIFFSHKYSDGDNVFTQKESISIPWVVKYYSYVTRGFLDELTSVYDIMNVQVTEAQAPLVVSGQLVYDQWQPCVLKKKD